MRLHYLVLYSLFFHLSLAQNWTLEYIGQLPFRTSNNAVALTMVDGEPTIFSFTGIDESLVHSGIHLKAGSVNLISGESKLYQDVPDSLGKIAAAASVVGNRIFIIGGYHVFEDGSEKSSNLVHCFNPQLGQWESDRKPLPMPIDDHVQCLWQDSLIYVITGWSNTKNVPDVQVYDPALDSWQMATPVPDNNRYKAFGASGTIIGNTIYYLGGASMTNQFPASFWLRIGEINPDNPIEIEWRDSLLSPTDKFYRSACVSVSGYPIWFGGSNKTYNYDGLSYSDGKLVQPSNQSLLLSNEVFRTSTNDLPMDIRGVGEWNATSKILAGGIYEDLQVSNQVIRVTWGFPARIVPQKTPKPIVAPNPANNFIYFTEATDIKLYNTNGKLVIAGYYDHVSVAHLPSGIYWLTTENKSQKILIRH